MNSTETETAVPDLPRQRGPEREALAPWSPMIPTEPTIPAQRGIRWLDAPAEPAHEPAAEPPAGLGNGDVPPGRSRRLVVVLAVVLLLAAAGATAVLAAPAAPPTTMAVPGSLVVAGRGALVPGDICTVAKMPGRTVSVFAADGTVVGSAALPTSGTAIDQWQTATPWADACRFSFTVGDLPADEDTYRVGLDGDPSHAVSFSREELTTTGVQLTYGH